MMDYYGLHKSMLYENRIYEMLKLFKNLDNKTMPKQNCIFRIKNWINGLFSNNNDKSSKILNNITKANAADSSQCQNNFILIRTTPNDGTTLASVEQIVNENLSIYSVSSNRDDNSVADYKSLIINGLKEFPKLFHQDIWSEMETRFVVVLNGIHGDESLIIRSFLSKFIDDISSLKFIDIIHQLLVSADAGNLKNDALYWNSVYCEDLAEDHPCLEIVNGRNAILKKMIFIAIDYTLPYGEGRQLDDLDNKGWLVDKLRAATHENAPYLGSELRKLV